MVIKSKRSYLLFGFDIVITAKQTEGGGDGPGTMYDFGLIFAGIMHCLPAKINVV